MHEPTPSASEQLAGPDELPPWLAPVHAGLVGVGPEQLSRFVPKGEEGRRSAVLVLLGEGDEGPDILMLERAPDMRAHAGQPAFPGGMLDPGESPVQAALREAQEETGLDPAGVRIFAQLPDLWLPPSSLIVTPVVGWWQEPTPVWAVDAAETAKVARIPVSHLTDPANRVRVAHPSGFIGPGFEVSDMLIWGFTGGLLSRLLALVGWELPWDESRIVPIRD